jgi:hypothetical protein
MTMITEADQAVMVMLMLLTRRLSIFVTSRCGNLCHTSAFGLVPVVAVDIVLTTQVAEAKGCPNSIAANASQGRCVNPGN